MQITALLPWGGSKRTLAARIIHQLGPHRCYWEPFCGSMAVLLGKPVATMETVNDLHGDLINFARHVQNPATWPELHDRLQRTLFAQELWRDSQTVCLRTPFEPTINRAYHYFVFSWAGRNGSAGTNGGQNFCVRYTSNGGSPGTRFREAVDAIPEWAERLRAVIILSIDGFGILERLEDKAGTAAYIDPPYIQKGFKYVHDFTAADHGRLAKLLRRFTKTRVVVSYYDHPELAKLYDGWTKIPLKITKAMVNAGRRDEGGGGGVDAPEVLLINGPAVPGDDELPPELPAPTAGGLFA